MIKIIKKQAPQTEGQRKIKEDIDDIVKLFREGKIDYMTIFVFCEEDRSVRILGFSGFEELETAKKAIESLMEKKSEYETKMLIEEEETITIIENKKETLH